MVDQLDKEQQLRLAFWKIKEELNEHLDSINQNTGETQEAFEAIARLELKLDRMEARLEQLELRLSAPAIQTISLSAREQEIFSVLMHAQTPLTLKQMGAKADLAEELVQMLVGNLVAKGIPVLKRMTPEQLLYYLDSDFKEKERVQKRVRVSAEIAQEIESKTR